LSYARSASQASRQRASSLTAPLGDGQAALCWVTPADGVYYVANAGSNTLSGYTVAASDDEPEAGNRPKVSCSEIVRWLAGTGGATPSTSADRPEEGAS
jgi:hypothetical protein